MCTNDKGKQTNKQTNKQGAAHVGVWMQGAVQLLHNLQSLLCNASEYVEGLWRCSEKHGVQYTRSYSDITPLLRSPPSWVTHGVWGRCGGVAMVEVSDDIVSIRSGSYPTQTSTTEGTNVCLKESGPTDWPTRAFFLLGLLWTSLGFSTNPKTHFITP